MVVRIYADGAAIRNPGPSGYGTVLIIDGHRTELSGGFRYSSNNRAELTSVIVGLRTLDRPSQAQVISDSEYVVKGSNSWRLKWKKRKWKGVKNLDLWLELDALIEKHQATFRWVRGHTNSNDPDSVENRRCDQLAETAAAKFATGIDMVYEKLMGYQPKADRHPVAKPELLPLEPLSILSDHEKLIQSELTWINAHLESD
jgi:ribonuclease HI